jgi:hypothetical protein
MPSETVTIVFTDLVSSTELLSRAGEERAEEIRREHFDVLRTAVAAHAGRIGPMIRCPPFTSDRLASRSPGIRAMLTPNADGEKRCERDNRAARAARLRTNETVYSERQIASLSTSSDFCSSKSSNEMRPAS